MFGTLVVLIATWDRKAFTLAIPFCPDHSEPTASGNGMMNEVFRV
jgi:hypothetical protein